MKRAVRLLAAALFLILLVAGCGGSGKTKWHEQYRIVAHALGSDGDEPYNCLEGFLHSYDRGQRVFECDLVLTTDERLVLSHSAPGEDEGGEAAGDFETFMNTDLEGGYTPMSFSDMLGMLSEREDIYLVTDFKAEDSDETLRQMGIMREEIRSGGFDDLMDRIIIQFYREEELERIKALGDFGGYIFSLYKRGFDKSPEEFEAIADFCRRGGVDVIVMKKGKWSSALEPLAKKHGVKVFTHTVYTTWQEELMRRTGAGGSYCDRLGPQDSARVEGLAFHWYEKSEGFETVQSVDEARELYSRGARAFYLEDMTARDAPQAVGFLREHEDACLGYTYSEDMAKELAECASGGRSVSVDGIVSLGDEGDSLMARTVVFTSRLNIFNRELKNHIFWCDVVYLAGDEDPEDALDSAQEKGIATVAFPASAPEGLEQLGDEYDIKVIYGDF